MRYSNTGFVLLGQLIERVTGQHYSEYIEQRVLRPAGAMTARFCDPGALVRHLARGYAASADGLRPADHISPRIPFAAGGFCGTAGDLAAWNAGFHGAHGGAVLRPETYAAMTRPPTIRGGRRTRYGFGVALNSIAGRPAVSHGGDIDGFTTFTAYLPADSLSVTVLINTQGPTRPDLVASAVIQSVLGQPRQADPGPAPKSPLLFIGKYGEDVQIDRLGDDATRLRLLRGPLPVAQLRPA